MWGRNQKFELGKAIVQFVGDPHLGRSFKTGTPLDRLGDRSAMQWELFESLLKQEAHVTIIVGDLFDKFNVPGGDILRAAVALLTASGLRPNQKFIVLRGNHDLSRDATKRSAFDLLTHIARAPNILFVNQVEHIEFVTERVLLVPYDAFQTGEEYLSEWMDNQWDGKPFSAVVGHWDTEAIAGKTPHNMIPIPQLLALTDTVFTGHIHKTEVKNLGFTLYGTGSMQAYAHGEDLETEDPLYVTLTLDQIDLDSDYLKNKCVRVLLKQGEVLPELDCLQLTKKYIPINGEEDSLNVELIEFDMNKLLIETLMEEGVTDPEVIQEVADSYHSLREETLC